MAFKDAALKTWDQFTHVRVNSLNGKCTTLPILTLSSKYSRSFHLSWLGFWVAFLSWFAFSPLVPEAVKADLQLTAAEIGNSNIVSLCATLLVRVVVGPLVDRYGPRQVMAWLLILGAIPSGLAGTIHNARGLYVVRFFIGILGGTFVPCQAWTTAFFDKRVVGRANALVGGWGNSGGGFTFIIMVALYNKLRLDGLSMHSAWRAAFAIVPLPALLLTAAAILIFGVDHPYGRWQDRHKVPVAQLQTSDACAPALHDKDAEQGEVAEQKIEEIITKKDRGMVTPEVRLSSNEKAPSGVDIQAVNQELTLAIARDVILNPLTWLPSLAYMTTFGFELAIDANLANVLFSLYTGRNFGQTKAGYIAGIYGLLNVFARPLGGYLGDLIYKSFGVPGKKYLTLTCGAIQGVISIGLGVYIDRHDNPKLAVVVVLFIIVAIFNEIANGANFSLVPHCNPNSNGFMTGIVGAMGNMGGVFYAIIFRFQPKPFGKAFWISGILTIVVNVVLMPMRVPHR
ncbi:nitrate transporter [Obba rivulosa]|uniref:Nitrate/nitrite transporter n=1 Tax=Obba rivulosa TaxID=1052685 RepID=A0A8E2B241_9APHY|nr:nitrate transporter [Obba rivulosa]